MRAGMHKMHTLRGNTKTVILSASQVIHSEFAEGKEKTPQEEIFLRRVKTNTRGTTQIAASCRPFGLQ